MPPNNDPQSLRHTLQWLTGQLRQSGVESAKAEARTLLEAVTGLSYSDLLLNPRRLTDKEQQQLQSWLTRRQHKEPLQHITGSAHFYGLELRVSPAVLIPRPETETLVALVLDALKSVPEPRVLDVGTGSGAVALAIKAERPDAQVVASDISKDALLIARENATRLKLDVQFIHSDLLQAPRIQALLPDVTLLVSNLPYLPDSDRNDVPAEVHYDPPNALYSGTDGLNHLRRLLAQTTALSAGTHVQLELDPRNVRAAFALAKGFASRVIHADLAQRERFLLLTK